MRVFIILFFICLLSTVGGCSWFDNKSNYGDLPYRHSVKYKGESIGILSEWYTGDVMNWRRVVEINKNIDPNKIEIGDIILIPKDLIIRNEPMTEEFCNLKNQPSAVERDPVESDFEKRFKSPLRTKQRRETEELIKDREELWNELIGE